MLSQRGDVGYREHGISPVTFHVRDSSSETSTEVTVLQQRKR